MRVLLKIAHIPRYELDKMASVRRANFSEFCSNTDFNLKHSSRVLEIF